MEEKQQNIILEDYEIENFLNLKAPYNGNLGTLQHNTQHSMQLLRNFRVTNIITKEDFEKYYLIILEYFRTEIKQVLNYPTDYIN